MYCTILLHCNQIISKKVIDFLKCYFPVWISSVVSGIDIIFGFELFIGLGEYDMISKKKSLVASLFRKIEMLTDVGQNKQDPLPFMESWVFEHFKA